MPTSTRRHFVALAGAAVISPLSQLLIPSQAQAKQWIQINPPPLLSEFNPTRVLRGNPQMIAEFKNRVVVVGTALQAVTEYTAKSHPTLSPQERAARNQEIAKADQKRKTREYISDLKRLHQRLFDNPDVRFVLAIQCGERTKESLIDEEAKKLDTTATVIEVRPQTEAYSTLGSIYTVKVFDAKGTLRYAGTIDEESDKAIRDALRELKGK